MRKRIGRVLEKPASRAYVGVLFVLICVLIGIGAKNNLKIRNDEHQACLIQRRGLPATHALAKINADMNFLLTIVLSPKNNAANKKAVAKYPPALAYNILWTYKDWNRATGYYAMLIHKQPATRSCNA